MKRWMKHLTNIVTAFFNTGGTIIKAVRRLHNMFKNIVTHKLLIALLALAIGGGMQWLVNTTPDMSFAGDSYVALAVGILAFAEYLGLREVVARAAVVLDFGEELDKVFLALDFFGVDVPDNVKDILRTGAVEVDKRLEAQSQSPRAMEIHG